MEASSSHVFREKRPAPSSTSVLDSLDEQILPTTSTNTPTTNNNHGNDYNNQNSNSPEDEVKEFSHQQRYAFEGIHNYRRIRKQFIQQQFKLTHTICSF